MKNFLQFGSHTIEYTVFLKKKRTIGISVSLEHGVRVTAPKWVTSKQIREIIEEKAQWILKKQSEIFAEPKIKDFGSGGDLFYQGLNYPLAVIEELKFKKCVVKFEDQKITAFVPTGLADIEKSNLIQKSLILWYKKRAEEIIGQRIAIFTEVLGVNPTKVTIRAQKTRWGSCSSKGNINMNWRLVMMPMTVIDYVVVHELAHLKVLNHSKDFWKLVESVIKDYQERKKRLKEYGKKLNI